MSQELLILFTGIASSLVTFWITQRNEFKKLGMQQQEARLNELVDRLQHPRQYVRASAVTGIGDLVCEAIDLRRRTPLIDRGLSQLTTMLHTEEDGAVLEMLFVSVGRIARVISQLPLELAYRGELEDKTLGMMEGACFGSRRWLLSAASQARAFIGNADWDKALPRLECFMEGYYGLKAELLTELSTNAEEMGLLEWQNERFRIDGRPAPGELNAARLFGNCLYRHQVCLRTRRVVTETLRKGGQTSSSWEGSLLLPESSFKAGIRWPPPTVTPQESQAHL